MNVDTLALTLHVNEVVSPDPAFAARARTGLVWLPEHGVGYLPVNEQPYDAAYFGKYEQYADSAMGRAINDERIALVRRHSALAGCLIDVGIGSGAFLAELDTCTNGVAFGYDVNPAGIAWLEERGMFRDPYAAPFDVVTFWDALEHIPDIARILANVNGWVFCSLPIVPGDGPPRRDWRHWRSDEHCWYFTRAGLIRWMAAYGFACVEHSTAESLLGREDIGSFAFRRVPA